MAAAEGPKTKKFGKGGERTVPHHSQKASKYYPATDEKSPKKVRKSIRPTTYRASLKPGAVCILLAGRHRGKRVILINQLDQGVLLVTGPFKVNGVPIRRVNARYVMATSTQVDIKGIDKEVVKKVSEPSYWQRKKSEKKKGEDAFFKQGEKPEVSLDEADQLQWKSLTTTQKKKIEGSRASDQKALDKPVLAAIRKVDFLQSYLKSGFSLRKNDKPHELQF